MENGGGEFDGDANVAAKGANAPVAARFAPPRTAASACVQPRCSFPEQPARCVALAAGASVQVRPLGRHELLPRTSPRMDALPRLQCA